MGRSRCPGGEGDLLPGAPQLSRAGLAYGRGIGADMDVVANGVRLFFDVDGEKLAVDGAAMRERPTIVLLHGGPGSDHSYFKPAFSRLREVAQLVYLDQRANGRSERGERARWHLAQWGDDVRAFCDALGIERPIVLGVSFGGIVALAYATRHPGHAGALVLTSTQATVTLARVLATFERLGGPRAREAAQRFWTRPSPEALAEYARRCWPLYTRTPVDPDVRKRQVQHADVLLHFTEHEDPRFDLTPRLSRIVCPTLVIGGEDDPITPIGDAEDLARGIGPARLARFAACGHGVFQDDPEGYFALVRAFVEEVSGAGPPCARGDGERSTR